MDISKYGMTIEKTDEAVSDKVTPELNLVKVEPQEVEMFSKSDSDSYSMDYHDSMEDIIDKQVKIERDDKIDLCYEDIKTEIVDKDNVTNDIRDDDMTQDNKLVQVADSYSMDYHDDMDNISDRKKIKCEVEIDLVYENIKKEIVKEDNATDNHVGDPDMTQDVKLLQSDVMKVQERIHTEKSSFQCTMCSEIFIQHHDLKVHEESHSGNGPFQCEICLKVFTRGDALKTHKRTHTGEKSFQCTFCSKSITRKYHLRVHERSHTGEKPFQCKICLKAFTRGDILKIHERNHTGERPFQCTICSKSFSQKNSLKFHERSHTGEKPFMCTVCSKSFTRNSTLKVHKKSHTTVE